MCAFTACSNHVERIFQYPETRKDSIIDEYFGVKVTDPYRWLEQDTSAKVAEWVKAQNKVTFDYLSKIPFREKIKERLTALWNFEKQSPPFKKGAKYYFYRNDGLQNQSILYMKDRLDGKPKIFINPNKFSKDGTVALDQLGFSKDGKLAGYAISKGGSDWNEIFVIETETRKLFDDYLKWVKFSSIAWYKDGFFYSRYDVPKGSALSAKNVFHKLYYHKIGTTQKQDLLIFENRQDSLRTFYAQVTEDEKYLIVYENAIGHGNILHVKNIEKNISSGDFISLNQGFDYEFSVIDNIDAKLLVKTNYKAPKYKVIQIDIEKVQVPSPKSQAPSPKPQEQTTNWTDLIAEKEDVLETCGIYGGNLVTIYMHKAHSIAEVYNINGGKLYEIILPGIGTISSFVGKKDENTGFFGFSSYTVPSTVYKFDFHSRQLSVYFQPSIDFDCSQYETKQVLYKSKDSTGISMFICHKKGLELDGNAPALLYGYGGFNISMSPGFSMRWLIWLENGGILAIPNLRGGGEYGEEWHLAGTKLNKQNVFDDFIAAAEYLIREKYTSPEKLAIMGGSNGGLLVGACINQRPELFRVALPAVGVMDMLRFHKFTIGWGWAADYGSSDDSAQFHYILKYSPLHNISEQADYPAVLVTTADHDDRVVPAHSFKYIATLQEKYKGNNPVMIRIDVMAGHGAGKPTSKNIEEYSDIFAFIFYNMGVIPAY